MTQGLSQGWRRRTKDVGGGEIWTRQQLTVEVAGPGTYGMQEHKEAGFTQKYWDQTTTWTLYSCLQHTKGVKLSAWQRAGELRTFLPLRTPLLLFSDSVRLCVVTWSCIERRNPVPVSSFSQALLRPDWSQWHCHAGFLLAWDRRRLGITSFTC